MSIFYSIAVRPNYSCILKQVASDKASYTVSEKSKENLQNNKHDGNLSINATKKFKQSAMWLCEMAKRKEYKSYKRKGSRSFKVSFLTLTLCGQASHTDTEIKHDCLNQLLTELRYNYKLKHYVWKAERQDNGNIHFHLLTDKYLPYWEVRNRWNRILKKLGYIDTYRTAMRKFHKDGFKVRTDLLKTWSYEAQYKAYEKGTAENWHSPNSVDVRPVKNIRTMSHYLIKYCTKDNAGERIKGRLWACSYSLSKLKSIVFDEFAFAPLFFERLRSKFKGRIIFTDWADIVLGDLDEIKKLLIPQAARQIDTILSYAYHSK